MRLQEEAEEDEQGDAANDALSRSTRTWELVSQPEGEAGFHKTDQVGSELMMRDSIADLLSLVDNFEAGSAASAPVILDGPAGCGKSMALQALVQHARASGWIVLFVPHAHDWISKGNLAPHDEEDDLPEVDEVDEDEEDEDDDDDDDDEDDDDDDEELELWNSPKLAQALLTTFKESHGDQVAAMPLQSPRSRGAFETLETIGDLVSHGARRAADATNCAILLREELALVTE